MCARGQAALQVTYHPDRLDKPLKGAGERGSGQFVDISWDEVAKYIIMGPPSTPCLHQPVDLMSIEVNMNSWNKIPKHLQQLFGPGDLAVTIDYRDILAETVLRRLGNTNLDLVFPGYTPTMRGVFV